MTFAQYKQEYWPIIGSMDKVYSQQKETYNYLKILRIYDDEKNFQMIRSIMLESIPFRPQEFDRLKPSYVKFRNFIYYFKRIHKALPAPKESKGKIMAVQL